MTPEQVKIFNRAMYKQGCLMENPPAFWLDFLDEMNFYIKSTYVKENKYLLKPFPTVIIGMYENCNVNASVTKIDGNYVIGVSYGLICILDDLFNRMLAHPSILEHIGDVTKEKFSEPILSQYYTNILLLFNEVYRDNYSKVKPIDCEREKAAAVFTKVALRFVVQHELSHILFGHIDYLMGDDLSFNLNEYFGDYEDYGNLDRQIMEFQADITAMLDTMHTEIQILANVTVEYQYLYKDKLQVILNVFFAIYNCIRIFGDGNYTEINVGKTIHPEPRLRQLMLAGNIHGFTRKYDMGISSEDIWRSVLEECVFANEKAFTFLTGVPYNKDVFKSEFYWRHPLHLAIHENWNSVQDKLKDYRYSFVEYW